MLKKLIIFGSVFFIDQLAKILFVEHKISRLAYHPWSLIFSVITVAVTTYFCLQVKNTVQQWGFLFLLAGGLSNLYDYIVFHGVRDYLFIGSMYFNIADISIVFGLSLFLLSLKRSE